MRARNLASGPRQPITVASEVAQDATTRQRAGAALTATSQPGRWAARSVCVIALVWCGFLLLVHWAAAGLACAHDTSYCALNRHKNGLYRGTLVDRQGRPITDTAFSVSFESRRRAHPREVGGFSTDAQGRYCIVWAAERITPFVHFDDVERTIQTPWQPLNGPNPPRGCQSGNHGIPWNRADDATSSPQFIAVPALAVPGALLLLVALVAGVAPTARRPRRAGLALTVASTMLAALVWLV
jgi:hypothetical protein